MALLALLIYMGLLTYYDADGKSINLKIDTEDIVTLVKSFMNSDILQDFATHVYQRNVGTEQGSNNPFHPEDELTSFFDAAVIKNNDLRKKMKFFPKKPVTDTSDKVKESFLNDHDSKTTIPDSQLEVIGQIPVAAVASYRHGKTSTEINTTLMNYENITLYNNVTSNVKPL